MWSDTALDNPSLQGNVKAFLKLTLSALFTIALIETASATALLIVGSDKSKALTQAFPANFRQYFNPRLKSILSATKQGDYSRFYYPPNTRIGFLAPESTRIAINGKYLKPTGLGKEFQETIATLNLKGFKPIIALGGSTTDASQETNWPLPLSSLVHGKKYYVINAGHNGYTSQQERDYVTSLLLPLIHPIKPAYVVALDGLNDASMHFSSFISRNKDSNAFNHPYPPTIPYNPYQYYLDLRLSNSDLLSPTTIASRLVGKLILHPKTAEIAPYFTALAKDLRSGSEPKRLKSIISYISTYEGRRVVRLCETIVQLANNESVFSLDLVLDPSQGNNYFKNINDFIRGRKIDATEARQDVEACQLERSARLSEFKYHPESSEFSKVIAASFSRSITMTKSILASEAIPFRVFIQPLYNPTQASVKDINSPDEILLHQLMRSDFLGHPYKVPILGTRKLFADMAGLPEYSFVFDMNLPGRPSDWTWDGIHYTESYSRRIAMEIFKNL